MHGNVDDEALRRLHERRDDFQIFNPGSPTERRRAPQRSMGLLQVRGDGLHFEHVWLGGADAR